MPPKFGTHTRNLIYKIEIMQRRAARWVFSDYDFHSSVSSMLKDLNWSTLEERRKANRLTLLSRIVHHQEPAIQMPQNFFATDLHHQTIPPTTFYITTITHPTLSRMLFLQNY